MVQMNELIVTNLPSPLWATGMVCRWGGLKMGWRKVKLDIALHCLAVRPLRFFFHFVSSSYILFSTFAVFFFLYFSFFFQAHFLKQICFYLEIKLPPSASP